MSSDYRMNLIWASHGEQFRADLERNLGGLRGFGQQLNQNQRQLGTWGQQMKAVSTTIRYAFAGAVVYGAASAVSGLADFQKRLGEIDSLAAKMDSSGRLQGLGHGLDQVGDYAIQMSNKFGIAVDDVQQYMMAFYSSFDAPAGQKGIDQMKNYVEVMSQLSLIAEGADPTALSRGLASLSIASGRGPAAAGNFRDIIASVISQSPVIRGEDIARDAGRLAAAQTASGMTPEQVFGAYLMASKSGGSGSQIGRGISTLLTQSIVNPTSKSARQAFSSIGLPTDPNALRQLSGETVLKRMMAAVITGPVKIRNRGVLGDENTDDSAAIGQAGVQGVNIALASKLIPQQWALRQFLGMLAQGGPDALDKFVKSLQTAEKTHTGIQRAAIVQQQSTLQRTQQAQKNIFLQLTRGFSPILNTAGEGVIGASNFANRIGPTGTVAIAGGGLAANMAMKLLFGAGMAGMAGKGIGRLLGGRGASMLGRMGLGRLLGRSTEMGGAALIGSGIGAFSTTGIGQQGAGSRTNPLWVVIDPLSWFMPGSPSGGGGIGGGGGPGGKNPPFGWWKRAGGGGKGAEEASRLSRLGRFGVRALPFARGATIAGAVLSLGGDAPLPSGPGHNTGHRLVDAFLQGERTHVGGGLFGKHWLFGTDRHNRKGGYAPYEYYMYDRFRSGKINANTFQRWLSVFDPNLTGHGKFGMTWHPGMRIPTAKDMREARVQGEAIVTLALEASPYFERLLKNLEKRTHVPVKLWPKGGGGQPPQSRGKQKAPSGSAGGRR